MSNIYLFDVDGTLTSARSRIDEHFKEFFINWCKDKEVYIVSGGSFVRLIDQLGTDVIDLTQGVFFVWVMCFTKKENRLTAPAPTSGKLFMKINLWPPKTFIDH